MSISNLISGLKGSRPKSKSEDGEIVNKAMLRHKVIIKDDKKLVSSCCEYFCSRTVEIDDSHSLKVMIDEPGKYVDDKQEVAVLRNSDAIEEYLLGLDNSLSAIDVYKKMMELLQFSEAEIRESDEILIYHYIKVGDEEGRLLGKYHKINGRTVEYAVTENGETYDLFAGGDWNYVSDDVEMTYRNGVYRVSVSGSVDYISALKLADKMDCVTDKIERLRKNLK